MNADALKPMWNRWSCEVLPAFCSVFAAVFWPALTLAVLVYIFSIYILINGLIDLVQSIMHIFARKSWLLSMILGVAQIGVGIFLIRRPGITLATLVLLIGLTLIIRGVFEVVMAMTDEPSAVYRTLMVITGLLSLGVGVALLLHPLDGSLAFVWLLGLFALITGPIWIALGVDAKRVIETGTTKKSR